MVFPSGSLEFLDETITESEGRAVWERLPEGGGQWRDPDAAYRRWYPDGSSELIEHPILRSVDAVERLGYDFNVQRIRDSYGRFVGTGALVFPEEGVLFTGLRGTEMFTTPFTLRPEAYEATPGTELIERVVFINRDGSLRLQESILRLGNDYDPSHHSGGFIREGMAAAGVRREGPRLTAEQYKKVLGAVIHREYLVREVE